MALKLIEEWNKKTKKDVNIYKEDSIFDHIQKTKEIYRVKMTSDIIKQEMRNLND